MKEIVIALCMFYQGGIIEHTYKDTMSDCLKSKRIASREVNPTNVRFACGKDVKAKVEYIKEEGQTAGRIRILEVLKHDYTDGNYDSGSRY